MRGSTTASGVSWINEGRSSTSKTRSKLTSAVITSIRALDRLCSGPSSRTSSRPRAVNVPSEKWPRITSHPPTPYTSAVASAGTSCIATVKTRVSNAIRTPTSRTTPAFDAKCTSSSSRRPKSLSSIAPPTLNRSVMALPRSALPFICSRVNPASCAPTQREVTSRIGKSSRHSNVTCQLRVNMVAPTTSTEIRLATVFDSVEVKARCAPITSLFSRLTSAPVWVRVKNASDCRCTWAKTLVRRSKISPSPIREER